MKKKSKYSNIKDYRIINKERVEFDSRKEARVFDELYTQLKAKKISNLSLQPEFELVPSQKWNGATLRAVKYRADFRYTKNNKMYIIDAKGFRTKDYIIKMKMFVYQNPDIIFKEV